MLRKWVVWMRGISHYRSGPCCVIVSVDIPNVVHESRLVYCRCRLYSNTRMHTCRDLRILYCVHVPGIAHFGYCKAVNVTYVGSVQKEQLRSLKAGSNIPSVCAHQKHIIPVTPT